MRKDLAWRGAPIGDFFHASEDKQEVRDEVFAILKERDFSVQATVLEKSKAQPHTRNTPVRFYQYAWFYHFKWAWPKAVGKASELLVTAASIGQKAQRAAYAGAVADVLNQNCGEKFDWKLTQCPAMADPCLQVADYCTWAMQRKWERGDTRSYEYIAAKINHEYESWKKGEVHYY